MLKIKCFSLLLDDVVAVSVVVGWWIKLPKVNNLITDKNACQFTENVICSFSTFHHMAEYYLFNNLRVSMI